MTEDAPQRDHSLRYVDQGDTGSQAAQDAAAHHMQFEVVKPPNKTSHRNDAGTDLLPGGNRATDNYILTLDIASPSHRLQKAIMPRESHPYSRVGHIGNGEFVARLGHNGADGWLMPMANARKQAVFNLKIQPPKIPGSPRVMRSKRGIVGTSWMLRAYDGLPGLQVKRWSFGGHPL